MNTEVEYSAKDVTVSWKPTHGINNLYLYSVDGGEFIETSETELLLTDLEEGWHIVEVKVVDSISLPDRFTFIVDTEGPLVSFSGMTGTSTVSFRKISLPLEDMFFWNGSSPRKYPGSSLGLSKQTRKISNI